ncbi:MAG TPA: CRISPR-associated endonuclease Cas2 [Vicinamibacterales bacterium]|nr:CRISPR-associated endonuclease Cas2 [Vicinamibacterales bacterium]
MRKTYLVCYDISDDFRRSRVLKTMKGYGDHLQYSVFECQLNATGLARCRHALSNVIHHKDDQVLFVDLGPTEGRGDRVISSLGRPYSPLDAPCIVVDGSERRRGQSRIGIANEERAARHVRGED